MANVINVTSNVLRAQVFKPREEGWSEQVTFHLSEEMEGYIIENGERKLTTTVTSFSSFYGEVVAVLCAQNATIAAFMSAKSHEEKIQLLPVILAGAKVVFTREHNDAEKKMLTKIVDIEIEPMFIEKMNKALDALFGF